MKLSTILLASLASYALANDALLPRHGDDEVSDHKAISHSAHSPVPSSSSMDSMDSMTSVEASTNSTMNPSPASMHGGHHHNRKSILEDPNLEPQQRAYWEQYNTTTFLSAPAPNKFFLYSHIGLNVLSWVFVYPLSLALSVAKSPFYLFLQTFQFALFITSLLCLAIYGSTAPADLYPNNAYSRMSIAMFFITSIHWFAAVIKALANWAVSSQGTPMDGAEYVLANLNSSSRPVRGHFIRPSQDSGHGVDSDDSTAQDNYSDLDDLEELEDTRLYPTNAPSTSFETASRNKLIARIMSNKKVYATVSQLGTAAKILYSIINRPLFVVGISYLLLGTVTLYRMGLANNVYNILAHFIKGTIFFLYGILTLQRYLGAFANRGMAWNIAPGSASDPAQSLKSKKSNRVLRDSASQSFGAHMLSQFRIPTMEFVECSLIFIYGCSNVFMEHLGNTTGKWSHKDLQHVSIAFMYFGGGLCGLLVESSAIRRLINRAVSTSKNDAEDDANSGMQGSVSLNPFPAFIVFWTGVLMSQHEQALPLSTSIHMQWGYLFSIAALFRLGTYVLMFLSPPKSTVPSRPITELITSFCLICGGLVFVQSNSETVEGMMYRSLDSMFTLNVNVGITALIMSWIMVVMAIKAWATKRQSRLALSSDA